MEGKARTCGMGMTADPSKVTGLLSFSGSSLLPSLVG